MNENNEMMVAQKQDIIAGMEETSSTMYMSFNSNDLDDKKLLYMATNGGTLLKEVLNKTLKMMDVVITEGTVVNKETGAVDTVPRTSIITAEGEVYTASSWGVYNCLKRINAIFGGLHFEEGLPIIPKQVKTKNGFTMTIDLA